MSTELSYRRGWWQPSFAFSVAFFAVIHAAYGFDFDCVDKVDSGFGFDQFPVRVGVVAEDLPEGLSREAFEAAVDNTIDTWNRVTCATAVLERGDEPDILIQFADSSDTRCLDDTAVGFTYFTPCDAFDANTILLNSGPQFIWGADPQPYEGVTPLHVDATSVITHEMGHALGLLHIDDPLATMTASYLRDGGQASLSAADKLSLCHKYPGSESECVVDDDCGQGTCVSGEFKVCEERRAEIGDFCALDERVCETCLLTSPDTFSGYCTAACGSDEDCMTDWYCNGEGYCQLEGNDAVDGCATSSTNGSWIAIFVLVIVGARRRRETRSSMERERNPGV